VSSWKKLSRIVAANLFLSMLPHSVLGAQTRVTTYVTKVQEERESTKWTLTEWLRIKERMKLMDLWLAMFSEPARDRFRPEFYLSLQNASGQYSKGGTAADHFIYARGQFWLTNLFSGVLGIKLLNIDLGLEGGARQYTDSADGLATAVRDANSDIGHYSAALRFFGKHIQDTSLVLKYGAYDLRRAVPTEALSAELQKQKGVFLGAELQIYLLKSLGILGNYHSYEPTNGPDGANFLIGQYYDYGIFVDVSVLRISAGQYAISWDFESAEQKSLSMADGRFLGLSLHL
jgi:hypothetical protein